jgi:hypothetical protein
MSDDLTWVRDACTLPTAERPLRRAEFDDLFAATVDIQRPSERHLRVAVTGDGDLAAQVRDLAARETDCCSFFTFTVTPASPGRVVLDIEVPAGHVDVLDALAARASALAGGR